MLLKEYTVLLEGGLQVTLDEDDFKRLIKAIQMTGKRLPFHWARNLGVLFMLDKILAIKESEVEYEPEEHLEEQAIAAAHEETQKLEAKEVAEEQVDAKDTDEAEEKEPTLEEKREAALAEIIDKSNCKHEDDKLEYFYNVIKTKKGYTNRYFPVCSYCGQRFRFVAADKLTDEQKASAKLWEN